MDEQVDLSVHEAAAMFEERMEQVSTPADDKPAAPEAEETAPEAQAEEQAEGEESAEETAEEKTEDEETKEPEDAKLYTVKVAGEEVQVTLEELLNGFSRTADYTRKTQAVSELQKQTEAREQALEAQRQAMDVERQRYQQVLSRADELLKDDAELTVDMAKVEAGDQAEKDKYIRRTRALEKRQVISREQEQIAQRRQQEQAQQRAKALEGVQRALTDPEKGLPGWHEEAKMNADIDKMERHLEALGFKPEALQHLSLIEGFVRMAHDSMVLKQMKASPPKLEKKPATPPMKAGAKDAQVSAKNKTLGTVQKRFSESGGVEDLAALFEARALSR